MQKPWQAVQSQDPQIFDLIEAELVRQRTGIELIASENFASIPVMSAMASVFTNKYAEGLPGKRYYGGCEITDRLESLAIERVCKLFQANFANVQPHSGAQANAAVMLALLNPGDPILGMDLSHGGHLTHGSKVNFSGKIYQSHFYQVEEETGRIDYDKVAEIAHRIRPKVLIAGASAHPRILDFKRFREIADAVGAYLLVDMAHIAGLVATGLHPSPIPHAHVVTTTTHKTLRGPRGGVILWNDEKLSALLNKAVFPGTQGGPLEHVIAAKAVCFLEADKPEFQTYQQAVVRNAQVMAQALEQRGFNLVTGGTDNHLILVNLLDLDQSGKDFEEALSRVDITVNKNTVPKENRSPFVTSGLRVGTPAVTSRGMREHEMREIAQFMHASYEARGDLAQEKEIRVQVRDLAAKFPLYPQWDSL